MRCSGEAEEGSGQRSGENHPEMPSKTHLLPRLIFFLFFFSRREHCIFQPALLMSDCAELC